MKMIADLSIDVSMSRCPCDGFLRLVQCTPIVVKIYPHIYPLWDIAFALVFIYTDSVEVLLISKDADGNVHAIFCKLAVLDDELEPV